MLAGLPPGTQFDAFQILDSIRATLHAQAPNAERLDWALRMLVSQQEPTGYVLQVAPYPNPEFKRFPADEPTVLAVDSVRATTAAALDQQEGTAPADAHG
jgi:hypothetical protein